MKNVTVSTGLLKNFVLVLINRNFGNLEYFQTVFNEVSSGLRGIPITNNPVITMDFLKNHLADILAGGDMDYNICAL